MINNISDSLLIFIITPQIQPLKTHKDIYVLTNISRLFLHHHHHHDLLLTFTTFLTAARGRQKAELKLTTWPDHHITIIITSITIIVPLHVDLCGGVGEV